ncbi:MAG: metallophosphoesterase family protein [Planctomycetota bacterium]
MKKSLLFLSVLFVALTLRVTFCPKMCSPKVSFSPKAARYLIQPSLGCPGLLSALPPLELKEAYLKVVVNIKTLPFQSAQEASQSLDFRLVASNKESSALFISSFIPPVLEAGQFTAYLGTSREEPLPAGIYTLELLLNKFTGKNELLDRQPNAVWVEEELQSGGYSFLVLQGTQFNTKGKEAQIFQNFLEFLKHPTLERSNVLLAQSLTSRNVLNDKAPAVLREENLKKTLARLKNVKFVVINGDLVRPPQEIESCAFSKEESSLYQKNYEAFYETLTHASKPFFLVPGNRDAQIILHPNRTLAFDGLQFFETYLAPLRSFFSYRNQRYALFNTYELPKKARIYGPDHLVPSGGFVSESLLNWLKTIPSPHFVFAHHDPRGCGYPVTPGFNTLSLGNLQDWNRSEEEYASWMKPTSEDYRLKLLEYLANLTQANLFFASPTSFYQERLEGGENLFGWKNFNDWRAFNLGPRYLDDFLIGTLLFECYYFLPSILIQERLSQFDKTVSSPDYSLLSVSLAQIRLGCPTLKGMDSNKLIRFVTQLEGRIQNMGPNQLRQFTEKFEQIYLYFKSKPEFLALMEQIIHYRNLLDDYKKMNPRIFSGIDRWREGISRFLLDKEEQAEYSKTKELRIREKAEQRTPQKNFLSLFQTPAFVSPEKNENTVLLVTFDDKNNLDIQPLAFHFERSAGCYVFLFLLIALELFCFQWTRSFWEGMASAFLETGEDFFGCPSE